MGQSSIELMAPAGSFAAMQAAIDNGANSIYFGVEQLSMRARSTMNFKISDLAEISKRCSEKNIKTYITLNTVMYDHDLKLYKSIIDEAKKQNISAVIASDQGVLNYASEVKFPVHISTQVNVTNIETLKFYAHFSDTMVLSRELTLSQVKSITDRVKKDQIKGPSGHLIKIEVFGHGALCMAVSGKCYLSLHTHNASANRGACVQNCRRSYVVTDKEEGYELEIDNEYIMSAKDLNTIGFLDKIKDAGIQILKIEGRGRAAEYVAKTIKCYREALNSLEDGTYNSEKVDGWNIELSKVYNRGFWDGYYLGQKMGEWTNKSGTSSTEKKVFLGKAMHYFDKAQIAHFKIETNTLNKGDKLYISGPTTGVLEITMDEFRVNNKVVKTAQKGDEVTFPLDAKVRLSDKMYKILPA